MVRVASELEREGWSLPLLIGGATTSRAHTAVKIDQRYSAPVVWVKDASRSVPAVSSLLSTTRREAFLAEVSRDYESIRARHAAKSAERPLISLSAARANAPEVDFAANPPVRPRRPGRQVIERQDLRVLRDYIDWGPFFQTWEMKGRFPDILSNPASGEAARRLFDDAQEMLDRIIEEEWLTAAAAFGIFPAASVGDDILVYEDETRRTVLHTLHTLRQQGGHREGVANKANADYVAPADSGIPDWVGAFAVTAGLGAQEKVAELKAAHDDYSAILLESLADRLAEAFAEWLHEQVRRDHWGYAPHESLANEDLISEKYVGIRPAPGYPSCPDHTEKQTLWEMLDVETTAGIALTESMAMWPGASVSGWYFSHPQAGYFVVGRLGPDQVAEYAERKGWDRRTAERWLAPNLGYEPED
jgi:5-methyltetrahydrofolate--homocysteine methyltransferase